VAWELTTAQIFSLAARTWLREWSDHARRIPTLLKEFFARMWGKSGDSPALSALREGAGDGHGALAVPLAPRDCGPKLSRCLVTTPVELPARWYSPISIGGKRMRLGTFDTREQAQAAYQEAVRRCR
jgi:hypothetical protein